MGRRVVLIDRDGVINPLRYDPDRGCIDASSNPDQFTLLTRVAEAIKRVKQRGFLAAIVFNQPGVPEGKLGVSLPERTNEGGSRVPKTWHPVGRSLLLPAPPGLGVSAIPAPMRVSEAATRAPVTGSQNTGLGLATVDHDRRRIPLLSDRSSGRASHGLDRVIRSTPSAAKRHAEGLSHTT